MSKMVLVFDGREDLEEYYGKEILIHISIPTDKNHKNKYTLQGFKHHSSEYTILKPMPERQSFMESFQIGEEYKLYASGWNDCIDGLLGDKNNE